MDPLTLLDVLNLFSAAISIVLAVVALWLAIYFYQASQQEAQKSLDAASDIAASVSKLEKIFDTLYADTFSMMRDTVTDMRQHVWKREDTMADGESADPDPLDAVRQELMGTLESVTKRLGVTEGQMAALREQVTPAVTKAIEETREMSAIEVKDRIRRLLLIGRQPMAMKDIVRSSTRRGISEDRVVKALFELRREGRVDWQGPSTEIAEEDIITYIPASRRNPQAGEQRPSSP